MCRGVLLARRDFQIDFALLVFAEDERGGFLRQLLEEGHIGGEPVILRAEVVEVAPWGGRIRIHTDHGLREVSCYSIAEESPFAEPTWRSLSDGS